MILRTISEASGYPPKRGRYPLVLGVRPSLSATGIAMEGWTNAIFPRERTGDTRVAHMIACLRGAMRRADLVIFQGPSPRSGPELGCEDLAGLRVGLRLYCYEEGIPYAIVPPHAVKTYATGRPTAERGAVRTAVAETWCRRTESSARYERAEAYVLTAMGLDWTGWPLRTLPARQRDALRAAHWPTALPDEWWA